MPRAEEDAIAVAQRPDGSFDSDAFMAEYKLRLAARHESLLRDSRAVFRAMDGWAGVKSREEWEQAVQNGDEEFERGHFLIDRLGAERHLDPTLMAVLIAIRRRLIEEHEATGAADLMLVDLAVIAFYHTLRINGWIGNFAWLIEDEFFQNKSLSAKFEDRYGRGRREIKGLRVEDHVQRIAEELLPLVERFNGLLLRNIGTLEHRHTRRSFEAARPEPANQLNVGLFQLNTTVGPADRTGA
jgi:hypothetical protein